VARVLGLIEAEASWADPPGRGWSPFDIRRILKALPALSAKDAERLLNFVAEAERLGGDQPFTAELLVELGRLVDADWVAYSELDRVRRWALLFVDSSEEDSVEVEEELTWRVCLEQHPMCVRHQDGHFGAMKLSDFLTRRELHRSWVYNNWFRLGGVEHELVVAIPSPLWHTKTFIVDRPGGRDFTERDRLVLDLLQPHLARLWQAARTRQLLSAALAELDRVDEHNRRGLILLGPADELEYASPPSQRLLREFFPDTTADGRLPAALAEWLESDGAKPFIRRRGQRQLKVARSNGALILEERDDEMHLTAREREVLSWVARGETNAEIARLLWLAPSTVRKHLENVYAKLGVSTRTAAVARFFRLLDAEAS
jgi:DNA-binding CsgD family transcriptional regulator